MRGCFFVVWLLLLGSTGCLDALRFELPAPDGANSIVYVQGLSTRQIHGVILRVGEAPSLLRADEDVWAFAYAWEPTGVLDYGEPFEVQDAVSGQPLQDPIAAYRATPGEGQFQVMDASTEMLNRIRLRLPDIKRCTESEGCLSKDGLIRCEIPCTAQEPTPPEPVDFECPQDWRPMPGPGGLSLCAPQVHETQACSPEQWQGHGPDCLPLGDCEAGGDPWPPIPPGDGPLIYVDSNAAPGGDGSRQLPVIDMRLAAQTENARILLAPGDYLGPVFDADNVQVHARCPDRTRLYSDSRLRILSTGVQLTGVQIDSTDTGVIVASRASLTLDSVEINAVRRGLIVRGDLDATRLKIRAQIGLRIQGGQTELTGVDHVGIEAVRCNSGELKITDMRAIGTGTGTAAVSFRGCSKGDFERLHIQGHNSRGIFLMERPYDISIVDTHFIDLGASALETNHGETSTVTSRINLERLYFDNIRNHAIKAWSVELTANQIVVNGTQDPSVDLRQGKEGPGYMQIDNLWVTMDPSQDDQLVRVGQVTRSLGAVSVRGRNWVLDASNRELTQNPVLEAREDGRLTLSQAYIEAGDGVAIDIACGDADLADLVVSGGNSGAITSQPLTQTSLRRVSVRPPRTELDLRFAGLLLQNFRGCGNAVHVLQDVNFENCPGCEAAILTREGANIQGTRIAARGYNIGIDAREGGTVTIRGGVLEDNRVGVSFSKDADPYDTLRGVRLNNRVDIVQ